MKQNTCGSCRFTDNKLGVFSLHCSQKIQGDDLFSDEDGKVRSWESCSFEPSRWRPRIKKYDEE